MPDGYVLKSETVALIKQMLAEHQRSLQRGPIRPRDPEDDHQAPEVYVARTPAGGIPGLDVGSMTGTGTAWEDDVPGEAECEVYRRLLSGVMSPITGLSKTVRNLSKTAVTGDEWLLVARDKFGDWWPVSALAGSVRRFWVEITARTVIDCGDVGTAAAVATGTAGESDLHQYTWVKKKRVQSSLSNCLIWEDDDEDPEAGTGYEANNAEVAVGTIVEMVEVSLPVGDFDLGSPGCAGTPISKTLRCQFSGRQEAWAALPDEVKLVWGEAPFTAPGFPPMGAVAEAWWGHTALVCPPHGAYFILTRSALFLSGFNFIVGLTDGSGGSLMTSGTGQGDWSCDPLSLVRTCGRMTSCGVFAGVGVGFTATITGAPSKSYVFTAGSGGGVDSVRWTLKGVLDAQMVEGGSAVMSVWGAADTGENVTVYDWLLLPGQTIEAGAAVTAQWDEEEERYCISGASCATS